MYGNAICLFSLAAMGTDHPVRERKGYVFYIIQAWPSAIFGVALNKFKRGPQRVQAWPSVSEVAGLYKLVCLSI